MITRWPYHVTATRRDKINNSNQTRAGRLNAKLGGKRPKVAARGSPESVRAVPVARAQLFSSASAAASHSASAAATSPCNCSSEAFNSAAAT